MFAERAAGAEGIELSQGVRQGAWKKKKIPSVSRLPRASLAVLLVCELPLFWPLRLPGVGDLIKRLGAEAFG